MTTNNVIPISSAAASARETARSGDGKFGTQHKPEAVDVNLAPVPNDPPVVALAGEAVKPGDQIMVNERWMEVGRSTRVQTKRYPNPAHNRPGHYVLLCTNGFQKAVRDGETIETVQADENGIPALTSSLRDEVMTRGYDSGTPEYVDWCDECGDYHGFSVNSEKLDPRKELCHGCEDGRINGERTQYAWGDESGGGSFVNKHGVDMTPGQTPTAGYL